MLELERRRLTGEGKSPAEVNASVKVFADFYNLYLMKGMTPGQVIAQHPEWKSLWYDTPDGQYGRPAAFYQQLQALNLGEAWQKVTAPVLVIRGGADDIMSRADSEAIAQIVNQVASRSRPLSGGGRHGPWLYGEGEISRRHGAAGHGVDERATALTLPFEILHLAFMLFRGGPGGNVPRFRRRPVLGFFFREYKRYCPDFNLRIIGL